MRYWINFGDFYFNRKTGEIIKTKPDKNDKIIDFKLNNWETIESSSSKSDNQKYFFNKIINVNTWRLPYRINIKLEEYYPYLGPSWVGNSCYLDSVIVCVLCTIDPFTKYLLNCDIDMRNYSSSPCHGISPISSIKSIKDIQKELKNIHNMLVDDDRDDEVENISKLRKLFSKCPGPSVPLFCSNEQGDISEFIIWLISLFPKTNKTIVQTTTYFSKHKKKWKMSNDIWRHNEGCVHLISYDSLNKASEGVNIKDFLIEYDNSALDPPIKIESLNDGVMYKHKLMIKSIKYSPVLFLTLVDKIL